MSDGAAVDASPLLYLGRVGRIDLLQVLDPPIVVPRQVLDELRAGDPPEPAVRFIEEADWFEVVPVPTVAAPIRSWELGAGEASVLTWVHGHPGAVAVLDDLEARRCAASIGVSYVGTLAVAIGGKRQGRLETVAPLIEELRGHGMYLSDSIVREILALVSESLDGSSPESG